jgi:hypothetical protein
MNDPTYQTKLLISLGGVLIATSLISGCARSIRDVGQKYVPQIEKLASELRELSTSLPAEESLTTEGKLEPSPYYHCADTLSNMMIMSRKELLGGYQNVNDPSYFSLYACSTALRRIGYCYPEEGEDFDRYEKEMQALIDVRYILAYDLIDHRPPVINDQTFDVQPMKMILAVYDRVAGKWRASEIIEIEPPEQIKFQYQQWNKDANAISSINQHFRNEAQLKIANFVSSQLGGLAEFDANAYRRDGTRFELGY